MNAPVRDSLDDESAVLHPGKLWSLWDIMQKFDASGMLSVIRVAVSWTRLRDDPDIIGETARKNVSALESYHDTMTDIGLAASRKSAEKIAGVLKDPASTWAQLGPFAEELVGRLLDETQGKMFFALTLRESDFYVHSLRGWESVISRFPESLADIEEASKCFALSRHAAAVFHSVQVVEAGLIDLGRFINVTDPLSGWTAVTGRLVQILKKKYSELTPFEKANRAFLEQVSGTSEALKNAWRNKISHVHGRLILAGKDFSPVVAEEIIFATRSFMRRLAEGLPPKPDADPSLAAQAS